MIEQEKKNDDGAERQNDAYSDHGGDPEMKSEECQNQLHRRKRKKDEEAKGRNEAMMKITKKEERGTLQVNQPGRNGGPRQKKREKKRKIESRHART